MSSLNILGMDYGASNGRGVIGSFDGSKLMIKELHRFPNRSVTIGTDMFWDILYLYNGLKTSITKSIAQDIKISSIGIDTWGVDFGIIDNQGNLIGNPHSYRDRRTNSVLDDAFKTYTGYEIFSKTGMSPANIATLFQLIAMKKSEKAILEKGKTLLFMPNLLSYFLTGNISCDNSIASTSLMFDLRKNEWIRELLDKYQIPDILPELGGTGQVIGNIRKSVTEEIGIGQVPVVSIAHHDTASAVASVPAENKEDVIFISCGTWSVVGTIISKPLINMDVFKNGFCNIAGYDDEIMFGKNITGLWILQECEREWKREGYQIDYEHMQISAEKSGFCSFVDVNDPVFAYPGNMQTKIIDHCKKTGQKAPENKEEIFKCIILGLANEYREVIDQTIKLTGRNYKRIHIVGGGSKNRYLCKITSQLTKMEVIAGPDEATVIGNILAQLISLEEIRDIQEGVQIIKKSFPLERFKE